jgi:hypothetical protein
MKRPILVLISLLLIASAAHAQTYRCTKAGGGITYQDTPCAVGDKKAVVEAQGGPSREQQLEAEVAALKAQRDVDRREAEAQRSTQPVVGRTRSDLRAELANSQECRQATRSYENEASSIARTPATVQSKKRSMDAACGLGY